MSGGKETLGAYKDGKKHGLWTTYYSNQQIKDICDNMAVLNNVNIKKV